MAATCRSREHTLQCMEIWGGIEPVERSGLDAGPRSLGLQSAVRRRRAGGRCLLRDALRGRPDHADRRRRCLGTWRRRSPSFPRRLRSLLRKNINQKSQKRLVERLNRQFADMAEMQRFATALVITYLASTDRLSVCNAGHPRPLFYRASDGKWSFLAPRAGITTTAATCRWVSMKQPATRRSTL